MSGNLSKTEYLNRYLENDEKNSKRKKKTKQPNSNIPRLKIVDKNIDLKSITFGNKEVDEEDEAPVVADIIDDRPIEVKIKEVYESSRWKKLNSVAEDSSNITNDAELSYQQSTTKESNQLNFLPKKQTHLKSRHDSDSDNSPPRMNKNVTSRTRHDSDSDYSLPRRCSSPVQNKRRHDSDSDNSPKRQNRESEKQSKKSSSQRYVENSNKPKQANSDSDLSPERVRKPLIQKGNQSRQDIKNSDSDLSPPREKSCGDSPKKDDKKRPVKTLSGLKAGLQNAATLREETSELRRRERNLITKLDAELSGRNANTIVRDRKTGKIRDLEGENRDKEEKEKRLSEQQKKYSEWGKGIEQTEKQKSRLDEDMYEMTKPLARYCDDEDLEDILKSKIYDDDPMSEYMKKKRRKDVVSSMPEYNGPPPPPNRFGIKPGYRWDGVDRSNGFERKYFEQHSNKKAVQEEAYLWSVQNM